MSQNATASRIGQSQSLSSMHEESKKMLVASLSIAVSPNGARACLEERAPRLRVHPGVAAA